MTSHENTEKTDYFLILPFVTNIRGEVDLSQQGFITRGRAENLFPISELMPVGIDQTKSGALNCYREYSRPIRFEEANTRFPQIIPKKDLLEDTMRSSGIYEEVMTEESRSENEETKKAIRKCTTPGGE